MKDVNGCGGVLAYFLLLLVPSKSAIGFLHAAMGPFPPGF